jgi:cytochrome c biogenesis protein ResB
MGTAIRLLHNLWQALGSVRLAAVLLAALLLVSALTSLFPQMPADPAAREPWLAAVALRYGRMASLLRALGLFDAYHAPWFLALLALLLLNTLACTLQRWPGLRHTLSRTPVVVRPDAFYEQEAAQRAEWPVSSLQDGLARARQGLAQRRYRVYVERGEDVAYLYAERGRWGRISTLASHFAALALVLALVARPALGWQERGVTLLPGQVYPASRRARRLAGDWAVRTGPLTVERYPGGQPRDYRVPLAVLGGAAPPVTRTVRINQPLTLHGLDFHLQGYGPAAQVTTPEGTFGLAFTDDRAREVALGDADLTLRVAYRPEGPALFVEALDGDGSLLGSGAVADGQEIAVRGVPIAFALCHYTLWQVSHDPTYGLAVGAMALFLAATVVSLWVPYRRLWLRVDGQKGRMVGRGDLDALAGEGRGGEEGGRGKEGGEGQEGGEGGEGRKGGEGREGGDG